MTRLRSLALVAAVTALAACGGLKDAMSAHTDTVAKAGSQELSVERLATLVGRSQIPLQREIVKTLAGLWVDYQLLGQAAARNDSLSDQKTIDDALWAIIAQERLRKLGERLVSRNVADTSNAAQKYANGDLLSAKHILVPFGPRPGTPPAPGARDAARRKAEALRAQVTVANFSDLARQNPGDPQSAQQGGLLGVFPKGAMVAPFERALVAIKPGEIAPGIVESPFGYHIIYRPTYAEVSQQFTQALGTRTRQVAESTYLAGVDQSAHIDVKGDAPLWTKSVAQDVSGHLKDSKVLATSTAGDLTAGRVAQWMSALPTGPQLRQQIAQAPDSLVKLFVRQVARQEVLLKKADSAKITLDSTEVANLRRAYVGAIGTIWTSLGVAPAQLTDSAKSEADRQRLAAARVDGYLDRLVHQRAQYIDVPTPIEAGVRAKGDFSLNDAAIDKALE
ncbi:MAG TPA: peptidylprolyl isomerase, partial [Gemmatirosa sp.]